MIWFAAGSAIVAAAQAHDFDQARDSMVKSQIERRGIRDPRVLAALRAVPRHLFVPEPLRRNAYEDRPLPIGHAQTISQPYIVASMTELLDVFPGARVLEIGTGSGYQSAILAHLQARLYSIEIVEPLARQSEALLKSLGFKNVTVRAGDGYLGWPGAAPFDRIILTAAPPAIPQTLLDQLAKGGRLVAPVGREYQELVVVDKDDKGNLRRRTQYPVMFVPMVPANP